MSRTAPTDRCRIVLVVPDGGDDDTICAATEAALAAGDVASLIIRDPGAGESVFQQRAGRLVEIAHARDVAVLVVADTRVAGRVGADGIHLDGGRADIEDLVTRFDGRMMVGAGGADTRHAALELGEARPDYIFFGRFGYDIRAEPHPRNLALGEWWAELVEIPCIVMAGNDPQSVLAVARTGAEFVSMSAAVYGAADPAEAVRQANAALDRDAPRLGD